MASPAVAARENEKIVAIKRGAIPGNRMHEAVNDRNVWNVSPFAGTVISDIMKPEYWSGVAGRLRPWDHIEVTPEDNTWWCELLVRDVGQKSATVVILRKIEFTEAPAPSAGIPWKVDYTPASKWRVIRLSDGAVITDSHLTQDAAMQAAVAAFATKA